MLAVTAGWVFFRSPGLSYAIKYLGVMFVLVKPENVVFETGFYLSPKTFVVLLIAALASTPFPKFALSKFRNNVIWKHAAAVLYLVLFFVSITFVVASTYNPFIYFRF